MVVLCLQVTGITRRAIGNIYSQCSQVFTTCLSLFLGYIGWAPAMEKLHGHVYAHLDILSLENQCLTTLPDLKTTEKPCGHVSARLDILSLENQYLATLPDLKIMEKPHGHVSPLPDILSLENRCLATLPDLKTMEKPHGHVSAHPDILSLGNRCLATLPSLKSTMSASPLLQCLQISQLAQADWYSLNTSNHLLSEPPTWRAQCLSEGRGLLTCPKALESMSATERAQETALVIAPGTRLDCSLVCWIL